MPTATFKSARDLLLALRDNYEFARSGFQWPRLKRFNWALDWFDAELAKGENGRRPALKVLGAEVESLTFAELSEASSRVANGLRGLGARRGDRLLLMLGNAPALWIATLAAMKLGVIVIPATTLLTGADIADRITRGRARFVIAEGALADRFADLPAEVVRIAARGDAPPGWRAFAELLAASPNFSADGVTGADDPLLLYFTSGTTARPKLVMHSHTSYPVGHLSTMFGLGLKPGDAHLNISSPGWAKHAWSNFFAPWNAGACILALDKRFDARATLDDLVTHQATSFCAPPTVWRQLVQLPLEDWRTNLRELNSAGEPLNPEVIERVRHAWGLPLRDSYGQTETTMLVGNAVGQRIVAGSMGRPLPGYRVVLLDIDGLEADEGEIAIPLNPRPVGLMRGYQDDEGALRPVEGGYYRTGDVATRDAAGFITYVGRADDVFKSNDYRLSPFELESALIEHPAVAEAAVVPAPDPARLTVAKAFVALAEGISPDRATALAIFTFLQTRLAPYKRVRRIEFAELPKTISGKIRRVELRGREAALAKGGERAAAEFRIEDFPELR
ncbi:MAG: AMP-binding protein [Pseudomonadota bacterium]|nr:AMP-binding protein [Pseudomonadota bacterium]